MKREDQISPNIGKQIAWISILFAICYLLAVTSFSPVIRLPFAGDDLEHLRVIGEVRSAQINAVSGLFAPFNEQRTPILRAMYFLATDCGGLNGAPVLRFMLLGLYCIGATGCGLIVYQFTGSRMAMCLSAGMFAAASGFSGSVIKDPACGVFLLALVFLVIAVFVLLRPNKGGWSKVLLVIGCYLLAILGMNGASAFAIALVLICVLLRPNLPINRWIMAFIIVMVGGCLMALVELNFLYHGGLSRARLDLGVLGKACWLVYTAPLRFGCTWLPGANQRIIELIAYNHNVPIHMLASGAFVVWLTILAVLSREQRILLIALFAGAASLAGLIAVGRAHESYLKLYLTDRYYHFFLFGFVVQAGFLLSRIREQLLGFSSRVQPLAGFALGAMVASAIYSSYDNLKRSIPRRHYQSHAAAIYAGRALVTLIKLKTKIDPSLTRVTLLNGDIPFDGVHKNAISLQTLFFCEFPHGLTNVTLKNKDVSPRDLEVQNKLFDSWSKSLGATTCPILVLKDRYVRRPASMVDFRKGPLPQATVSGFYAWESGFRWLGAKGTIVLKPTSSDLILVAAVPQKTLEKLGRNSLCVDVAINGIAVGHLQVNSGPDNRYYVKLTPDVRSHIADKGEVKVDLTSDITWSPTELGIGVDGRKLSVMVLAVGFEEG
jgi:hypothetical protein